jgi:bacteriocin-type transport-associated protein
MTEVLLRELVTDDIAWLKQIGVQKTLAAGKILVPAGGRADSFCLLLDGQVAVMLANTELDPLQKAFATIEGDATEQQIATLECGEVFGRMPGLVAPLPKGALVAKTGCTVLKVPLPELTAKLQQDVEFAGRFYKFLATLWAARLQQMLRRLGRRNLAQGKLLRDAWLVFGEFHDSDVDWLMATGDLRQVEKGNILVRAGSAIDSLFLVLEGSLLMSWEEAQGNPLLQAFAAIEGQEVLGYTLAQVGPGALFGETPFLDSRLNRLTMQTLSATVVLAVPRRLVSTKLQQDLGFAGRFYRVICVLMGHRLQGVYGRLGYGCRAYTGAEEDELDVETIDRMGLAGRRFDLMLANMTTKLRCGAI